MNGFCNTVSVIVMQIKLFVVVVYYGQFDCSLRDRNPYKAFFFKTDTSIQRTLIPVLLVSVIKRFDCTKNQHNFLISFVRDVNCRVRFHGVISYLNLKLGLFLADYIGAMVTY